MYATILTIGLLIGQVRVWHDRSGWEVFDMADATTVWRASVDLDWDVAGNWSNGIPVNGATTYDVIFDPVQASSAPNVNLDQSADTVNSITFLRGWRHGIGASGTPLKIKIDSASAPVGRDLFRSLHVQGSGDYYFETGAGGSVNVLVDGDGRLGSGTVYLAGTIRNLIARGGMTVLQATATLTDQMFQFGNAQVDILAGAAITDAKLFVAGGLLDVRADFSSGSEVHMNAGTVNCHEAVRTLFYVWGGRLNLLQKGTLFVSNYYALGGIIDFSGSANTPDLSKWLIGPSGHIEWHPNFWQDPGAVGGLTIDLRERNP